MVLTHWQQVEEGRGAVYWDLTSEKVYLKTKYAVSVDGLLSANELVKFNQKFTHSTLLATCHTGT